MSTAQHSTDGEEEPEASASGQKRNALEWAVFGLGALVVLGLLGYLVYKVASGPGEAFPASSYSR